jgi:hypothetical protein
MTAYDLLDAIFVFQLCTVGVEKIPRKIAKVRDVVGRGSTYDGDGLSKFIFFPSFTLRCLVLELQDGELAEAVDLVLDSRGEDFGMFDEEALRSSWRRVGGIDVRECVLPIFLLLSRIAKLFKILLARGGWVFRGFVVVVVVVIWDVIEMVKVVHHELHDLRVIAEVVGGIACIAFDRLELDSTGFSFLS